MANDPWQHREFMSERYWGWVIRQDAETLRTECVHRGLLREPMWVSTLRAVQAHGPAEHNERLLDYVRPGERDAFVAFLDVVGAIGGGAARDDFERLLAMSDGRDVVTTACVEESGLTKPSACPVPKRNRPLKDIADLEAFARAVRMYLGDYQCDGLAKQMVKRKGGFVNNFRTIVMDWIRQNNCGQPHTSNLPGTLGYFVDQSASPTCNDFLEMIGKVSSNTLSKVEQVVEDTEFM